MTVELIGGKPSEFAISDTQQLLVVPEMKKRLEASELRGFDFLEVKRMHWRPSAPKLWCLHRHRGLSPVRRAIFDPVDANKCPSCGQRPLQCPGCGLTQRVCSKCGRDEFFVAAKFHKGESDVRIASMANPKREIIEARLWNGDDVFGDGAATFVSWRFVDYLTSVHVGPFVATPVWTNVAGLNGEQRRLIDAATKSISS
ncbi:MAG: hypothetical protein QGG36_32165 [Pirellulaceae bacterium]|nr:hypothetical protein [Pirellulaceae bacterium]